MQADTCGGVVAGGFARWMVGLGPEGEADDVDIYVNNEEDYSTICHKILKGESKESGIGYYGSVLVKGVRTFLHKEIVEKYEYPIQVIWSEFNSKEELLNSFDFSICQVYIDNLNSLAYYTPKFYEDILEGSIKYTLSSVKVSIPFLAWRLLEYMEKGFFLSSKEFYKIKSFIPDLDDKDYFVSCMLQENVKDRMDWEVINMIEKFGNDEGSKWSL